MTRFAAWLAVAIAVLVVLPACAAAKSARADQQAAEHALQRVKDLKRGIGVRTGRELTPALADLAARKGDLDAVSRKQAATFLARPTDSNDFDYYGNSFIGSVQTYCAAGSIYCFHWVSNAGSADAPDLTHTGGPAGVPDYIQQMAAVFDAVHACENSSAVAACADGLTIGMGWQEPVPDGSTGGGTNKFDVYIKDLFTQGFYGYAQPECTTNGPTCPSYMVMDKDYDRFATQTETGLDAMKVTAAHEYNHVLQFGYDVIEDTWMFESTATWAEEKVYPTINDYLQYLPDWVDNTAKPITDPSTANDLKIYGSAVWNHWLDHGYGGDDVIQSAWAQSAALPAGYTDSLAPDAYRKSIVDRGGAGFSPEFEDFSAATSEWRAPGSAFPDLYPDVPRDPTALTVNGSGVQRTLDHTTFDLLSVPLSGSAQAYTLTATFSAGVRGAIALVGRTGGSTTGGTVTTQITRLPSGGTGSVTLPGVPSYGRITAVLINSDYAQNGWGPSDWKWTHDNAKFTAIKLTSGPTVATSAATSLTPTTATLNGSVNPNGQATTYWFEYGTTTAYGSETTHTSGGSGTSSVAQSASIGSLTPGVTYHYRVVAQNGSGTAQGDDVTFTTKDPPVVTTGAATSVSATGATLNGTVDPRGKSTTYKFEYGTTTGYGSQVSGGPTTTSGAVSLPVGGLNQGTLYHYRVVATNADGTTQGSDQTFTTKDPPIVTTGGASLITGTTATVAGTLDPRGQSTTYKFAYGTTTEYGSEVTGGPTMISGPVSLGLSGLAPGTVYHYRLAATNAGGTTNGADQTFTTPGPPIVTTGAASGISTAGATLNGTVDPTGVATTWWFEYGTTISYGTETAHADGGTAAGPVQRSAAISGLTRGATYHFRIVADNGSGIVSRGGDMTFATLDPPAPPPAGDAGSGTPSGTSTTTTTTPQTPATPATPSVRALALTLGMKPVKLTSVLAKGLLLKPACAETCSFTVKLVLSAKDAKRLRLPRTIAAAKGESGTTVRARLTSKAKRVLKGLKRVRVTVVVTASAPDGRSAKLSKPVTLRR